MKRLWILLCTLAALTVAAFAAAGCPFPVGSAGGNGWAGGATQTYIKDVSIHPLGSDVLIVNACDIGTTNCVASNIYFYGKVRFLRGGADWHGSQQFPLRSVAFNKYLCDSTHNNWCISLAGDIDVGGGQINELQNSTAWAFDTTLEHPDNINDPTYITAPLGRQIVKIAGMGASPYQTLRFNYVNAANTGIATKDIPFLGPVNCP